MLHSVPESPPWPTPFPYPWFPCSPRSRIRVGSRPDGMPRGHSPDGDLGRPLRCRPRDRGRSVRAPEAGLVDHVPGTAVRDSLARHLRTRLCAVGPRPTGGLPCALGTVAVGGPEAAHQKPFIHAGGFTHRLGGPRTAPVLQQAADARTAVCEAMHGTCPNDYVPQGLGHSDTRDRHVPTSLRTMPVSWSSTLVDAGLTPLYRFGAAVIVRGVPYGVAVPYRTVVSAAPSSERHPSHQPHGLGNPQVNTTYKLLLCRETTAKYGIAAFVGTKAWLRPGSRCGLSVRY